MCAGLSVATVTSIHSIDADGARCTHRTPERCATIFYIDGAVIIQIGHLRQGGWTEYGPKTIRLAEGPISVLVGEFIEAVDPIGPAEAWGARWGFGLAASEEEAQGLHAEHE